MLHPHGIEVFLRPVDSHGEDARYGSSIELSQFSGCNSEAWGKLGKRRE